MTDHGLLPNYAFPERGVRFYGAIYNKHHTKNQEHKPVEVYRSATSALQELAPFNTFYTHRRQFEIQQIAIGNPQQLITETWTICGACGHIRRVEELNLPNASPHCPQCGHEGDKSSQTDLGQRKQFVEFAQSHALSYMEHYESLSGDRDDERQREFYHVVTSFDQTIEAPIGAVGDEELPFGIEYRAAMIIRTVNTGYLIDFKEVPFGPDQTVSETGFLVCRNCGVVQTPGKTAADVDHKIHRRSCQARRRYEKMQQENKKGNPFKWEPLYLYRQLKSEAIRLLLPIADDEDIYTLTACIYLGLRLRFEGNPAHLVVQPQVMPNTASEFKKHFLVIMDAVPGGSGFLKSLYQEKDTKGREGEGIMDILRRAKETLETCKCRKLKQDGDKDDTDGCYRCIRTYHMQYKADRISRERGIRLLNRLITSGEKRVAIKELEKIIPDTPFGSILEKKFVESLHSFVDDKHGMWETTIIQGSEGYRFSMPDSERVWDLSLQPSLGPAQGVSIQSVPDFLLACDDDKVKPVAIFTDGFEYHCSPVNRLSDDSKKRRSIIESGKYLVWNVTWDDLISDPDHKKADHLMVTHQKVTQFLFEYSRVSRKSGYEIPNARMILCNGMEQLKAFIVCPYTNGWRMMVNFSAFWPLQMISSDRKVNPLELKNELGSWQKGHGMVPLKHSEDGSWVYNDKASLTQDVVTYINMEDVYNNRQSQIKVLARLGDNEEEVSGSDYKERWRRFLACLNFYQFASVFTFWTTSESVNNEAPDIALVVDEEIPEKWQEIINDTTSQLRPVVYSMAKTDIPLPIVEYFNDSIDDDAFAELAWQNLSPPIAILAGDQTDFANMWQNQGWKIIVPEEIETNGNNWLIDHILKANQES